MPEISKVFGISMIILGLIIEFINQSKPITGAFMGISNSSSITSVFLGLMIIVYGMFIFGWPIKWQKITAKPHQRPPKNPPIIPLAKPKRIAGNIPLSSGIKRDSGLVRLAEQATVDQGIKRELDHLFYELSRNNLKAGLGDPGHLEGTDVFYLRGRNGGRLYYHQLGNGYEILAKSGKGNNQDSVINKLRQLYLKKK